MKTGNEQATDDQPRSEPWAGEWWADLYREYLDQDPEHDLSPEEYALEAEERRREFLGYDVIGLRARGVVFNIYPGFNQDELGILAVSGTAVRVAWFKDPDGNVLSVTNA